MEISVIIPTYKPDYYIWECLDSIKEQTLEKNMFEVVIILNGEKEPYYTSILSYIKNYKLQNFNLLYTEQSGVSNARNIGLNSCKGKYIAFIDDDDYIDRNYLKNFFGMLEKDTLFIANIQNFYEGSMKIEENTKYKENDTTENFFQYKKSFSYIGAKIIHKNIIKESRFSTKYKNGEDSLFMIEISKNIKQIKTSYKDSIYWRRIRKNSASQKKKSFKYIFNNMFSMIFEYLKLFFKKGYNKKFILIKILAIIKGNLIQLIKRGAE